MTCTASDVVIAGQYANLGMVSAQSPGGQVVSASDPSHYFGLVSILDIPTLSTLSLTLLALLLLGSGILLIGLRGQ